LGRSISEAEPEWLSVVEAVGAYVVGPSLTRDRQRSQAVVDEIAALPDAPPALALEADVSDEPAVIRAAAETTEAFGRLDGLINNAGWMPGRQPVLELDAAVLERVLRSNLVGSFLTTHTPGMEDIITPKHIDRVAANYPGGRIGQPEDIVGLVNFLCGDAAQHISGTVVTVRPPITG
jgi:NAD(P)-dependent dehydrogenase (short-subunit alcohol dehydrogenase family)